jgi:hypothetical protein
VVGAVKSPELLIVPPVAVHVTAVLLLPFTVAENCCVAPGPIFTAVGATDTDTTGAVTVTVALPDFEVSTTLVAVTL